MENYKFVQVRGPFRANQDIVEYIKNNINSDFLYVTFLGIQTSPGHFVKIDGQVFEIGSAGILLLNEIKINSIYFSQDEPETTLVDCILD